MPRISLVFFSLVPAILATGCASSTPPPQLIPQVQRGVNANEEPGKVLALAAECGSIEFRCPLRYANTVTTIVKSSMDFAGYTVVDSSSLRLETRQRNETRERESETETIDTKSRAGRTGILDKKTSSSSSRVTEREKTVIVLDGPGFDDLTVTEKQTVLEQAGTRAVLTTRIVVGAAVGVWSPNTGVEVMVKLKIEDEMAWASRCSASSNDFSTVDAALENAARCAVYGGTGG